MEKTHRKPSGRKADPAPGAVINDALGALRKLRTSGYWPYASPNPCSTEVQLRKDLDAAIFHLENASALDEALFGTFRRNNAPDCTVITQH